MAGENKEDEINKQYIRFIKAALGLYTDQTIITMTDRFVAYLDTPSDNKKALQQALKKLQESFKEVDDKHGKEFLNKLFDEMSKSLPPTSRVNAGILQPFEKASYYDKLKETWEETQAARFNAKFVSICQKEPPSLKSITKLLTTKDAESYFNYYCDSDEYLAEVLLRHGKNNPDDRTVFEDLVKRIGELNEECVDDLADIFENNYENLKKGFVSEPQQLEYLKAVSQHLTLVADSLLEGSSTESSDAHAAASSSSTSASVASSSQTLFARDKDKYSESDFLELCNKLSSRSVDVQQKIAALKRYVVRGNDINRADKNGNTLLHQAAANGLLVGVELLVSEGADIKQVNQYHQTVVDAAKFGKDETCIKFLEGEYNKANSPPSPQ